jgi:acyl-CoA thioester hydrolase
VEIGTVLRAIGRSSFTLAHGIFKDGACCATAEVVMVLFDETTRRSAPLTQALRDRLQRLAKG